MVAMHPRTARAWERAAERKKPIPDDSDPDGFIRAHGPKALAALCGVEHPIPDPIGTLWDAWAEEHPEEAAFRLAWPDRCDAAALRRRHEPGEVEQGLAILDADRAHQEATRRREELDRLAAERERLGLDTERAEGALSVEERASRYLATVGDGAGGAWKATIVLVRGFALPEPVALDMLVREYAPRYHRKIGERELRDMVRRAARSNRCGLGWLLSR